MTHRPIKTACWVKFLKSRNCTYVNTEGSHDKYKCPGCNRSIIHREKDKDIPPFHIHINLKTMGIPRDEFWQWVAENC